MKINVADKKKDTKRIKLIILLVIESIIISSSIYLGMVLYKTGKIQYLKQIIAVTNRSNVERKVKSLITTPESIIIDINFKNYQKLAQIRKKALKYNELFSSFNEFVPAQIRYDDKIVKVRIRLKGDRIIHFEDKDKWSFRIKVKGDDTVFGMKNFSIHKPRARHYIYEWIFHQVLKREDILSLRYEFINVTLNGKDLGIYALEEHFEKRLLEYNQRREGPIIRFNEDFEPDIESTTATPFNKNKWTDPKHIKMTQKAVNLLDSFKKGLLKISEVFDVKKLAIFYAVTDLTGAHHGALWKSMRFYYNPVTSKLEPIGFDGHPGGDIQLIAELGMNPKFGEFDRTYNEWTRMIFNYKNSLDITFFKEYVNALKRLSEPSYLNEFFLEIADSLEYNLNLIYKDFIVTPDSPGELNSIGAASFNFDKSFFYKRQNYIKKALNPTKKSVHFYLLEMGKNRVVIGVRNIHKFPVEILGISLKGSDAIMMSEELIIMPEFSLEFFNNFTGYDKIVFTLPEDFVWTDDMRTDMKVNYRILGDNQLRSEEVYFWSYLDEGFLKEDFIRKQPDMKRFSFLRVDETSRRVYVKRGKWKLNQNLIIPAGYKVIADGGMQLDLSNGAKILSYSPLKFIGTEEEPILITSKDSTGQGIIVMSSNRESLLEYVYFSNLSNPSQSGWELTGAVNFYESPVRMYNCQFLNNRSEDGLNIIRSEFIMNGTLFKNSLFDALDIDFGRGKIVNTSFINCGNDCVDVSGTFVKLENIYVDGAGDKGLSIGEASHAVVNNIKIKNSVIAVASKDESDTTIEGMTVEGCKTEFAVYQKKSEFGPASIKVSGLNMDKKSMDYMLENESSLIIESKTIKPNSENVKEKIYGKNDR